jgi:hypothetical protein
VRLRGAGHAELRVVAEPQAEQEHLDRLRVSERRRFIHPRFHTLRPTEPLRLVAREQEADGAVGPDEARLRDLVVGVEPGLGDLHDPRGAVEHDAADRLGGGGGQHELGAGGERLGVPLNPLRPRLGLAEPASRLDVPDDPVALGGRWLSRARLWAGQEPSDLRPSAGQPQSGPYQSYFGASTSNSWRCRRSRSAFRTVRSSIIRASARRRYAPPSSP